MRCKQPDPTAVGAKSRPTRPAQRQDAGPRSDGNGALRSFQHQGTGGVPSDPPMTSSEQNTKICEPPQPGAKHGRALERIWEDPTTAADEGLLPKVIAPSSCRGWGE